MIEQLELELFEPATFEQLCKRRNLGNMSVLVNPRLKRGWNMVVAARNGHCTVRIPLWLERAPQSAKEALLDWTQLPLRKRRSKSATLEQVRRKELEAFIFSHAPEHLGRDRHTPVNPATFGSNHRGSTYDVAEIFECVNKTYFDSSLKALVRWGAYASLTSYQMVRNGADNERCNCITIAGVYDHPLVPRFAVEAVMYHEMLHIAIPPISRATRRVVHSRAFRQAEQRFPWYQQWRSWERDNLPEVLRALRRSRKRKPRR